MIVDDWVDVDSLAGIEAILVSIHGVGYMRITDDELEYLIRKDKFIPSFDGRGTDLKLLAEKARREKLDSD